MFVEFSIFGCLQRVIMNKIRIKSNLFYIFVTRVTIKVTSLQGRVTFRYVILQNRRKRNFDDFSRVR